MPIFTIRRHGARRVMEGLFIEATRRLSFWNRKPARAVVLAGLAALVHGCAMVAPISSVVGSVTPTATLQVFNTTELRLQQKNFLMVKSNVMGESKGFSLLGLITIVPAKFTTAMSRLNALADLKPGSSRELANLVLEKDSNFYFLFAVPRTSVRADVIEFIPDIQPQPASVDMKSKVEQQQIETSPGTTEARH